VNAEAIAHGKMRQLAVQAVTGDAETAEAASGSRRDQDVGRQGGRMRELARQPLLLLMLALYSADPALPALDADLAAADLYRQLLENFARREAGKDLGRDLRADELDKRAQDHLDRLAIAALAMFNRGRQDISEAELGADLTALGPDPRPREASRPVEEGQRVIGEFFFVHAAEARTLTGPSEAEPDQARALSHREPPRRTYEFLHATFGEYLAASRVMSEIEDMAVKTFAEQAAEQRLRYGSAIMDDHLFVYPDDTWVHQMASWLIPAIAGKGTSAIFSDPPEGTSEKDIRIIAGLIFRYFRTAEGDGQQDKQILELLSRLPAVFELDHLTLAAMALHNYSLDTAAEFSEPGNPGVYGPYNEIVRRFHALQGSNHPARDLEESLNRLPDEAIVAIGTILRRWTRGTASWDY
jgi:hypothetical protein